MTTKIKNIAHVSDTLNYQYDFGSTTELVIKFLGDFRGLIGEPENIKILSRNTQPIVPCDECGKFPAVQICTECQWEGNGWLCEKCVQHHKCDDEMLLPVVNSPRTGVCAYSG